MKKISEVEQAHCDRCDKVNYLNVCLGCLAEYCWDCSKIEGKTFQGGVYHSGSGDGFFCNSCINNLNYYNFCCYSHLKIKNKGIKK